MTTSTEPLKNVPCVIIASHHPNAVHTGDEDLEEIERCIAEAQNTRGRDWLLWLGHPDERILARCRDRQVTPLTATAATLEQESERLAEELNHEVDVATLMILVCAPLLYREGTWWTIATSETPGHASVFHLADLLRTVIPHEGTIGVRVVFHPYRFWGSVGQALPIDHPTPDECQRIRDDLKPSPLIQVETFSIGEWRPHDTAPGVPRGTLPPQPPERVLEQFRRLTSAFQGDLYIVPAGNETSGDWDQRLSLLLRELDVRASTRTYGRVIDYDDAGVPGAIVFLRATSLDANWVQDWLQRLAVPPRQPPPVIVLDEAVPLGSPLERWMPTPDQCPRGPEHVFEQAQWLERLATEPPPAPASVTDLTMLRQVEEVVRACDPKGRNPVLWKEIEARLRCQFPTQILRWDVHNAVRALGLLQEGIDTLLGLIVQVHHEHGRLFVNTTESPDLSKAVRDALRLRARLRRLCSSAATNPGAPGRRQVCLSRGAMRADGRGIHQGLVSTIVGIGHGNVVFIEASDSEPLPLFDKIMGSDLLVQLLEPSPDDATARRNTEARFAAERAVAAREGVPGVVIELRATSDEQETGPHDERTAPLAGSDAAELVARFGEVLRGHPGYWWRREPLPTGDSRATDLLDSLERAYTDPAAIAALAEIAGVVQDHRADVVRSPRDVWLAVLRDAHDQKRLRHLFRVILSDPASARSHASLRDATQLARPVDRPSQDAATGSSTSGSPTALATLRKVLVGLYTSARDAQRVASDVGLQVENIDFSGHANAVWHDVLGQASKQGRVPALVELATREYPAKRGQFEAALEETRSKPVILFVEAPRRGDPSPDFRQRVQTIGRWVRRAGCPDDFQSKVVTADSLRELATPVLCFRPLVVHVGGPGGASPFSEPAHRRGASDALAGLETLFRLVRDEVRCVVLDGCYSEPLAAAIARHVGCVTGTVAEAVAEAAWLYAKLLYRELAEGAVFQAAIGLAREAMDDTSQAHVRFQYREGFAPDREALASPRRPFRPSTPPPADG